MWLYGALSQSVVRSFSVVLFDLLGAFILILLSRYLPAALRLTILGFGIALFLISIGDFNTALAYASRIDPDQWFWWRRPFQFSGTILVIILTCNLPFLLAREKLYQKIYPIRIMLLSVLGSLLLTVAIYFLRQIDLVQMVFFFTSCLVVIIFTSQRFILPNNELANIIRQLAVVFILSGLARLLYILFAPGLFADTIFDLFWCLGVTAASWTLIIRR